MSAIPQTFEFHTVSKDDDTWESLHASWKAECVAAGEDPDTYIEAAFGPLEDLLVGDQTKAWVFALRSEGRYPAVCQVNRAFLPGYTGPVLRVRFITLSPEYDLTEKTSVDYGTVLIQLLLAVFKLAGEPLIAAKHVKFHLASPTDQQFFRGIESRLRELPFFESVQTHGAWLYLRLR